ncbi:MAG: iron hydrogenase small subunit [Spirochaetia bacterium]|jgi:hypothetical protein|nr:iron hydrogenase small subunit [Spirochaetia bacterium]
MENETTRKSFLGAAAKAAAALLFVTVPFKRVFAGIDLNKARIAGIYGHDKIMKYRKSQDNPEIKQLYRDFLEKPNSHKAHQYLHTTYTDRSAGIKKLKAAGVELFY